MGAGVTEFSIGLKDVGFNSGMNKAMSSVDGVKNHGVATRRLKRNSVQARQQAEVAGTANS